MNQAHNKYKFVLRYVYALAAVMVIAAFALIAALYTTQQAENSVRDRVQLYYLASTAVAEQLARDTRSLKSLLSGDSTANATAVNDLSVEEPPEAAASTTLHSMRAHVAQLVALQDRFAGEEFSSTLKRLTERFGVVEQLLADPEAVDAALQAIAAFELNVRQLYRLHLVTAPTALANIQVEAKSILPNVAILAAILAVAVIVGWYVTHLLRDSLEQQEQIERTLAESREQMHHTHKLEALGQLVGGVAHDFNNLLTAILGQADLLAEATSGNEDTRRGLGEISRAAQQAASLTRQLLAFSRRQPIEPQPVDINELIREMEPMLNRLIGEHIELDFHYGDIREAVLMDPGHLHQLILNLFINARDAIPNGGNISLTTKNVEITTSDRDKPYKMSPGQYAEIVVTDSGVGMDKATRVRAFEPFFTTKGRGRGTGLGLATVHGIVTAANGHVFVESRPGKGARFDVYLPICGHRPEALTDNSVRLPTGSETVLVVEDEEQIRMFLRDGLRSLGYTVLTASGGSEGLDICSNEHISIDVIVSDVVMPDINGVKFMKDALPMQIDAVGIFMSGYTDDIVLQFGIDGSSIPVIQKPFTLNALAQLIRKRLGSAPSRKSPRDNLIELEMDRKIGAPADTATG